MTRSVRPSVGRSVCRLASRSAGRSVGRPLDGLSLFPIRAGSFTSMLLSEHLFLYILYQRLKRSLWNA